MLKTYVFFDANGIQWNYSEDGHLYVDCDEIPFNENGYWVNSLEEGIDVLTDDGYMYVE